MSLIVRDLTFGYDISKPPLLDRFNLDLKPGEIAAVVGNSGCGKSTLLRILAGLETRSMGLIQVGESTVQDKGLFIAAEKRQTGFVFQDYALFPFLTVRKNILFGMRNKSESAVRELVRLLQLEGLEERYPHELSGGQQQRVAVARTLAAEPKILMMDEPFSNLDETLVRQIRSELRQIIKNRNLTTIIVTHSMEDAHVFADRIVSLTAES